MPTSALLLTSGKVVEIAERQEFGDARDRNLAVAEGIDRAANFLSLNRPYDALRDLRDANNGRSETVAVVTTTIPATTTTTTTTVPAANDSSSEATTTTTAAPATTTVPAGRVVTDDAPLRVYVAGTARRPTSAKRSRARAASGHSRSSSTTGSRPASPGPTTSTGRHSGRTRWSNSTPRSWCCSSAPTTIRTWSMRPAAPHRGQ